MQIGYGAVGLGFRDALPLRSLGLYFSRGKDVCRKVVTTNIRLVFIAPASW